MATSGIRDYLLGRYSTTVALVVVTLVPISYAFYVNNQIQRTVSLNFSGHRGEHNQHVNLEPSSKPSPSVPESDVDQQPRDPISLPDEVKSDSSNWLVSYEQVVSKPVSQARLRHFPSVTSASTAQPTPLFREYVCRTHEAFSWTPQAFMIRLLIKEADVKQSFSTSHIQNLGFAPGDLVNGIYRVLHYERREDLSESLELIIDVPPSYKGPSVRGLLVAEMKPTSTSDSDSSMSSNLVEEDNGGHEVVFVNETWMWRRLHEPPTLLETPRGGWFHSKLAGWLILKGLGSVLRQ